MAARFEMIFSHSLQAYITYLIENGIVFLPLSSVLFISEHKQMHDHVKMASNYPIATLKETC